MGRFSRSLQTRAALRSVMSSAASINNATGFILFRLFLGLCESGIMPGCNTLLAMWYTREGESSVYSRSTDID